MRTEMTANMMCFYLRQGLASLLFYTELGKGNANLSLKPLKGK